MRFVHAEALVFFGDVVGVDADGDAEVDDGGGVGGLVFFAFDLADGLFEHGSVHLEADGFDVAGLLAAEHVACAAEFEVEGGDFEACAEVGEFFECGEAAASDFGEFVFGWDEEIGSRRGGCCGLRGRVVGRARERPWRSARLMMMVLARGMSRPFSMMEVATRTSYSWFMKASMTRSSSASGSWPWPMTMRAWGTSSRIFAARS